MPESEASNDGDRRRPKVLLVIKCMGYGGAERLLVDLVTVRSKSQFDYECAFVLSNENALVPRIEAAGVPVHDLGASRNLDITWMREFRKILLSGNYDLVHFHLPYAAGLGRAVVASLPKVQRPVLMYTEHSLWDKTPTPVRVINRSTIGMDKALIAVSPAARNALPRSLHSRSEVIVHGIDLATSESAIENRHEIRESVRSELEVPTDQLLAITVANLREEKGYDVLLQVASISKQRGLPIRFVSVGRGPLQADLEALHRKLELGESFRFLGPRDDVLRLLTGSDVFVLPSHHEGLPVTLMEATSLGMPMVLSSVGGIPEFITDETSGLLVTPGRPNEFADALERLCKDPALREQLGQGAKAVSASFDVNLACRQIEGIYSRLLTADC